MIDVLIFLKVNYNESAMNGIGGLVNKEPVNSYADNPQKKNGQQLGKENLQAIESYVAGLKAEGQRLPSREGKPNLSAIALSCGFGRQVFYANNKNNKAHALIEKAVVEIGLENEQSDEMQSVSNGETSGEQAGKSAHNQKRLDISERRVRELEAKMAVKTVEVETLRARIKDLETRLRKYETFEEVMISNGRRYIP